MALKDKRQSAFPETEVRSEKKKQSKQGRNRERKAVESKGRWGSGKGTQHAHMGRVRKSKGKCYRKVQKRL